MHMWGDKDVDWEGIGDAAEYIDTFLVRWGRVNVHQSKEKFGTVRVYLHLGWTQIHSITHPRHSFSVYPKWLWGLDLDIGTKLVHPLNWFVVPYHRWLYRRAYKNAVAKWPHLRTEILSCADFSEYLEGL